MTRFRKIDPRIWNDDRFTGLSVRAKLVFFFLLTHPHMTALGAFRASLDGLAAELDWPPTTFRRAFNEVESGGMVEHCRRHSAVALPRFLRYNRPQSPNVVKSWGKAGATALDLIPECQLKVSTIERTIRTLGEMGAAFKSAMPKEFAIILHQASEHTEPISCDIPSRKASLIPSLIPSLNMEKEKEQEKEREQRHAKERGKPSPKPSPKPSRKKDKIDFDLPEGDDPTPRDAKLEDELRGLLGATADRKREERRRT